MSKTSTFHLNENPPFDEGASISYTVEEVTRSSKLFGLINWVSTKQHYKYKIDDTYGELGYMPFYDKDEAIKLMDQLKYSYERRRKK